MSVASKLTQSVRQAKASAAKENEETTQPEAAAAPAPQASKPAAKAAPKTTRGTTRKRLEPEGAIKPFPYRRVWPD